MLLKISTGLGKLGVFTHQRIMQDFNNSLTHSENDCSPVGVNKCSPTTSTISQTEVIPEMKNIDDESENVIEENLNVIPPVINDGSAIPVKEKSEESINGKTRLPKLLLCNIQSFSNSNIKADKTSETEEVLNMNKIDICVFTETWLSEITKDQLKFSEYIMFHAVKRIS